MAVSRSPRYPNLSLSEAIAKAKAIYSKEHMSAMTPQVAAEAMGYNGINGSSLKTISSLKKYGLLDGRGDDVRLTKDAQTLIIDDPASPDYKSAISRCAMAPEIYAEIRQQFPGVASDRNISVYLEKQGFKPDAAAAVAKNYRDSMALVSADSAQYGEREDDGGEDKEAPEGRRQSPPPPSGNKVQTMAGERELTTGLLSKEAKFRLIVSGPVGVKEIERLISKLEFDKEILAEPDPEEEGGNK